MEMLRMESTLAKYSCVFGWWVRRCVCVSVGAYIHRWVALKHHNYRKSRSQLQDLVQAKRDGGMQQATAERKNRQI